MIRYLIIFLLLFNSKVFSQASILSGQDTSRRPTPVSPIAEPLESGEINKKVTEIALNLSKKSPISMNLGRAAFLRTNDLDYRRGVANAVEDFCNAATTPDAQEGLRAFLEKRQPKWKT